MNKANPRLGAIAVCFLILLPACAGKPYHPAAIDGSSFLQRAVTSDQGDVRVTVAVPDADEARALTQIDLYAQGIQPVWLQVENNSDTPVRLAHWSIDRNYFSPIEVAYRNRKQFSSQGYENMQSWFYENRLRRGVSPGETRSGLVYTHLVPGTKGFNLDIFTREGSETFTFFVPLPGFTADYARIDFNNLYSETEIQELAADELPSILQSELPCCATDASGELYGSPFNVVLVGSIKAVRRSLLRANWRESTTDDPSTEDARLQHFRQRPPDTVFFQSRMDSDVRMELRLWLSPWRSGEKLVWVGQASITDGKSGLFAPDSKLFARWAQESVASDVDSAAKFVLQRFWYSQSLKKMGSVPGVKPTTPEQPRRSFTGAEYYTQGGRTVMLLSEEPVAMDETIFFDQTLQSREHDGVE